MSVYFTSDLHFGHRKVAELRGFPGFNVHDETIIEGWRNYVRPKDQVWVLGDLAASSPVNALRILADLPGEKHLIPGNHDRCHPMHRSSQKYLPQYLEVFATVQAFARRRINGRTVLLSHFPYTADHTDPPRYSQYRLPDRGEWLLHGHTHSQDMITSDHEVHVGVDAWGLRPVSLDELALLIPEMKRP